TTAERTPNPARDRRRPRDGARRRGADQGAASPSLTSEREITMRWISLVPSPVVQSLASRSRRSTWYSRAKPAPPGAVISEAERHRADHDAPAVGRAHEVLKAFAFGAEPLARGDPAVVEEDRARIRRVQSELLLRLADREAGRVAQDDERADAVSAVAGIRA